MTDDELDRVFKALGDPTRRRIIDRLSERPRQSLFEICALSFARDGAALGSLVKECDSVTGAVEVATMDLADDLRMERDMVRHCFYLRADRKSETLEGIRALAVDKDHHPRWSPERIEDVELNEVAQMFASPWPAHSHPLKDLA